MKIILDAMGGDNAPMEVIKGAIIAIEQAKIEVILTGKVEEILRAFEELGYKDLPRGIEIVNATEVITMDDDPVISIRTKKDSSMIVGLNLLRDEKGDAFVSAGSTGALLTGATLIVKRVRGIRRAALAPYIPNSGNGILLIDCGANTECTPEYLLQFAFMGSYYVEGVLGQKNPRVGLLNNGSEVTKGTELQLGTYRLLEKAAADGRINFVGNVEASGVMLAECDVLVCDGYTGNILLKGIEGTVKFFVSEIKKMFKQNPLSRISSLGVRFGLKNMKNKMSVERIGGTILLGISKPVVKAHGSSNADAIFGAIRQAIAALESNVVGNIQKNIEFMKTDAEDDK